MLEIFLSQKAHKFLKKLDKEMQERIKGKIIDLKENPELGEPLKYSKWWKLRIGDYRVIYKINREEKKVIILFIGHRKKVYTNFLNYCFSKISTVLPRRLALNPANEL